jgi:hypothetical protein
LKFEFRHLFHATKRHKRRSENLSVPSVPVVAILHCLFVTIPLP